MDRDGEEASPLDDGEFRYHWIFHFYFCWLRGDHALDLSGRRRGFASEGRVNVVVERREDRGKAFRQAGDVGGLGRNRGSALLIPVTDRLVQPVGWLCEGQAPVATASRLPSLASARMTLAIVFSKATPASAIGRGELLEGILRQILRRGDLHQQQGADRRLPPPDVFADPASCAGREEPNSKRIASDWARTASKPAVQLIPAARGSALMASTWSSRSNCSVRSANTSRLCEKILCISSRAVCTHRRSKSSHMQTSPSSTPTTRSRATASEVWMVNSCKLTR